MEPTLRAAVASAGLSSEWLVHSCVGIEGPRDVVMHIYRKVGAGCPTFSMESKASGVHVNAWGLNGDPDTCASAIFATLTAALASIRTLAERASAATR